MYLNSSHAGYSVPEYLSESLFIPCAKPSVLDQEARRFTRR